MEFVYNQKLFNFKNCQNLINIIQLLIKNEYNIKNIYETYKANLTHWYDN